MPKFGELIATDVWEAAARTLTDISAEEIFDVPLMDDTYSEASPVSSGTADTFGSWAQISADIGVGKRAIEADVRKASGGSAERVIFEIGEGASGSEVAVARFPLSMQEWTQSTLFLWKALTDNARISVRVKDDNSSTETYRVHLMVA